MLGRDTFDILGAYSAVCTEHVGSLYVVGCPVLGRASERGLTPNRRTVCKIYSIAVDTIMNVSLTLYI